MDVNQNSMEILKRELDDQLRNMINAYIDLSYNSSIQKIAGMGNTEASGYQYEMYQTVQNLRKFEDYISEYEDYYIYFRKIGLVVSGKEPVSEQLFFSDLGATDLTFEQWKEKVQSGGNDYLHYKTADGMQNLLYYNPLIWGDNRDQDVIFLAKIVPQKLMQIKESLFYGSEGLVVVLNQENQIMTASGEVAEADLELIRNAGGGAVSVIGNGKAVTAVASSVVGWRYAYILPDWVLFTDVSRMRAMTVIAIILSILISAVIMLWVLRQQYSPINKLINMFGKETEPRERGNEFLYLEDKLTETLKTQAVAEKAIDSQSRIMHNNYLRRFLRGRVEDDASVKKILQAMNCDTSGRKYAVMLFYVRDYTALFADDKTIGDEQRIDLVNFIIENIASELIEGSYQCFMVESEDMMAALVSADEKEKNAEIENRLIAHGNDFLSAIDENFNISCCISISLVTNSCFDIPEAYRQAVDAMEYAIITNENRIVRYEEIVDGSNETYHFTYEQKQEFIRAMKTADADAAVGIVDEVLRENASLGKNNMQGIVVDFVAVILRGINDIYKESSGMISQKDIYQVQKLLFCNDVVELRKNVKGFLEVICDRTSSLFGEDNLVGQIKSYVKENYADSNLNVASIGERFSKTPHYISKLFKDDQGIALLEYINRERIENSKQLLESTKKTLAEITEEVGFTNVVTFIRVFKKFEGITPGKYREAYTPSK